MFYFGKILRNYVKTQKRNVKAELKSEIPQKQNNIIHIIS